MPSYCYPCKARAFSFHARQRREAYLLSIAPVNGVQSIMRLKCAPLTGAILLYN